MDSITSCQYSSTLFFSIVSELAQPSSDFSCQHEYCMDMQCILFWGCLTRSKRIRRSVSYDDRTLVKLRSVKVYSILSKGTIKRRTRLLEICWIWKTRRLTVANHQWLSLWETSFALVLTSMSKLLSYPCSLVIRPIRQRADADKARYPNGSEQKASESDQISIARDWWAFLYLHVCRIASVLFLSSLDTTAFERPSFCSHVVELNTRVTSHLQ